MAFTSYIDLTSSRGLTLLVKKKKQNPFALKDDATTQEKEAAGYDSVRGKRGEDGAQHLPERDIRLLLMT